MLENVTKNVTMSSKSLNLLKEFSVKKVATQMMILCKNQIMTFISYREKCKLDFCADLCIKKELGDDENKKASWTMYFSRAPINSDKCISACYYGCINRGDQDGDDDKK